MDRYDKYDRACWVLADHFGCSFTRREEEKLRRIWSDGRVAVVTVSEPEDSPLWDENGDALFPDLTGNIVSIQSFARNPEMLKKIPVKLIDMYQLLLEAEMSSNGMTHVVIMNKVDGKLVVDQHLSESLSTSIRELLS